MRYDENRYFVAWPGSVLPENYHLAAGWPKSTLNKFQRVPQLFQAYATVIQEQLECGIIERVIDDSPEGPHKHYISHHAVVTPTKTTTKVRVVYETRQTNKSLNECLHRGLVMLPDLCGLLPRF